MRKLIFVLFILSATLSHAVPAERGWHLLSLRGGGRVSVQLVGDEFGSWYQSQKGERFLLQDGVLVPLEEQHLQTINRVRNESRAAMQQVIQSRCAASQGVVNNVRRASYSGSRRGLVIMVQFDDVKFSALGTRTEFDAMYNQPGYDHYNHIGSVHDYFLDQSYGQFDLQFDVVGPVTMPEGYAYYGTNYGNTGVDARVASMVSEACRAVDQDVDFSQYDWDGDGLVEQVFIIFAGYGAHLGGSASNRLYPMMWTLDYAAQVTHDGTGAITLDGVKVNTFAMASELASVYETVLSGIGVPCHEFSHCFGLPDVYDVNYTGTQAMGSWDVLDSGSYNGRFMRGEVPCPYTAQEKMECGWLVPIELSHPQYVTNMPCLQDEPVAYRISSDNPNEYYLVENRQHKRWDSFTGTSSTHGMLISHIDFDRTAWNTNNVNTDRNHPRITYFPADGRFGTEGGLANPSAPELEGDLFPGSTHNTAFTDDSQPAATLFRTQNDGSQLMHRPITDIVDADGLVSFTFDGGVNFAKPTAFEATDVSDSGFTALWSEVDGVETYSLALNQLNVCNVTENLEGFISAANGTTDLAPELDSYMTNPGWTGSKIFTSSKGMLLGSATANSGTLVSPQFSAEGKVVVRINARVYNSSDSKTLTVSLIGDEDKTVANDYITMTTTPTDYEVVFEDVIGTVRLNIAPAKRAYLASVAFDYTSVVKSSVFDGIETASYKFENLDAAVYTYKVRAVRGEEQTPWSNQISVSVGDATGVEQVPTLPGNVDNRIYNLHGQQVSPAFRGIVVTNGKKYLNR